ncbi:CAF17-like 4Fe-4S cluster assembly/insertion protein YgfZ [Marinobacterium jannaschii]|uniref:CAF17-like 4Fe-4S cluster assembly/insertion protein YgfZ n=1 Tax=Marinobacterium jannaschii TaxID=64970 RepID=UPI0006882A2C|nr:folate-binding protein YgfZ [Marinobacterium jannaschii]
MNNWLEGLRQAGAELSEDNQAILNQSSVSTLLIPLLHQAAIDVRGPDADKFLQGQLSADISEARQLGSRLAAHCNIKGHMIVLWRLLALEDGFLLRTDSDNLDSGFKTLNKYIMFSKADASDRRDSLVGIGLQGDDAAQLTAALLGEAPAGVDQVVRQGERVAVKVPGERFEIWLPADDAASLLPELLSQAELGSSNDWRLSEIRAGIPTVCAATSEGFIPQMTNLQALNGVSFTKGCYTGQEIVTRLQHRGILKRPMYLARIDSDQLPQPGDALLGEAGVKIGQVVQAAKAENGCELLAVMIKEKADNGSVTLESDPTRTLEILPLPYELDPRLFESKR